MTSLLPTINPRLFWSPRVHDPGVSERETIQLIRDLAIPLRHLPDAALARRGEELRAAVRCGSRPDGEAILVPAFALVLEAVRRTTAMELYDVQLLAGLAMTGGAIAEMQTGEGKTLAAALPALVHSLAGAGVHVMTVNSYLAERDYGLLAPAYRLLGATVGRLAPGATLADRQAAYRCDITYGPGYEFGFDYLRDQVALRNRPTARLGQQMLSRLHRQPPARPALRQRGHAVAIVDEADSVLIDEAITPLLLAEAPACAGPAAPYEAAAELAEQLVEDVHYVVDTRAGQLYLTRRGIDLVRRRVAPVARQALRRSWSLYVEQALRARRLLRRDVDYVVKDGQVRLVDQDTGRIFTNRSWQDGLLQAVQLKEGLPLTADNQPVARIARQRYFRLYRLLCGMTGTARGSERELWEAYQLPVVAIPPRRPCLREQLPTRFFASEHQKLHAVVRDISRRHAKGQPVLVGTTTIQNSETLAQLLQQAQIPFRLLNGKQDAAEASIVAQAGRPGAVTIATNMAGRGTDIKLAPGVAQLGGLHVIGCQPQLSSRVDRQLMGRAARQGDPGSCQLFVSADDPLIRRFAPALAGLMHRLAGPDGEIKADLTRQLATAQRRAERFYCRRRQQLLAHEDWRENMLRDLAPQS